LPAEREGRALRIGVGGPVGTGKSSLIATMCRELASEFELGVVTNDIYTDEDARFLRSEGVLPVDRIEAVQTGCCPHTAIRDDISANLDAVDELERGQGPLDVVFVESGGDNLTAAFSPALADTQIFVLDCAGGDDVPRKGGPGVARSDLLVINKVDLAPYVGASVEGMVADATAQRRGRPVIALSVREQELVSPLVDWIRAQLLDWRAGSLRTADPGPPAPHVHHHS
jgi:urease accessory protein